MAATNSQTFSQGTSGTAAIDTILTQEANRIGQDIYRRTLHVSPWMDLIKQTPFPEGMGSTLGTLIYDRALPSSTGLAGGTLGLSWTGVGTDIASSTLTTSSMDQLLANASDTNIGPATGKSLIGFNRQLKQYSLKRAVVESPRINVEDLRFAAYRQEQLRAVMDALTDSTRFSWEERYRMEYDRLCANLVVAKASGSYTAITFGSTVATTGTTNTKEGLQSWATDFGASGTDTPTANISNKICDSIYYKLVRGGGGTNAYGRENGRPVFTLVISSEASYALQTEAGFRDDVRYNNSKVSDLIAPLGVEKSFRGYYHLVDDLAPRFVDDGTSGDVTSADGILTRVSPYSMDSVTGQVLTNPLYETAPYEAAYVLHPDVMESQIPDPISGGNGISFDPTNYRGKYSWKNIPNEVLNPDGTIGFFRGVLASASKPIRTEFGFVILFKRDSSIPAA